MKVAFGMKAHSGWAALVAVGGRADKPEVIDRRRIELVEAVDVSWAKQPYHAAENLAADEARAIVKRGIARARRLAIVEMRAAIKRARKEGHDVVGCAVLSGQPMPAWSVDEILAVHFRMHKAEGVLFRDVLGRAAKACNINLVEVPEKQLNAYAERVLATSAKSIAQVITSLGKSIGPPWGKDQKDAALAAMIALHESCV